MPTDKPITLQEHAMRFGTFMGIFWIFKFIFLPLGFTIPLLQLLFVLLTLFVPVLGYIYVRKFRNTYCNGEISFFRAFLFTLYMYLFAALLAAVAHYVYFRFIDQGFLADSYLQQLESIKASAQGDLDQRTLEFDPRTSIDQLIQAFDTISSLTPLQLTFQLIFQNIFYGILLAIPTGLVAMKQKKRF